jgi:hypothetical protein
MSGEQVSSGFDWIQITLSSILLSGGVGAGVSAFFNYWTNLKVSKKKDEMRMVEDKLRMYALILYYLNELRFKFQSLSSHLGRPEEEDALLIIDSKNKNEKDDFDWDVVTKTIDAKLREQPHLISPQIHKKWVERILSSSLW